MAEYVILIYTLSITHTHMPFILLGIFLPRLTAAILYFFSTWFEGVFVTWYWPILGFIFAPYSMLWYSAVINWYDGTWGPLQIAVMALAVIIDLASANKGRGR
jgi:hypothetical protein